MTLITDDHLVVSLLPEGQRRTPLFGRAGPDMVVDQPSTSMMHAGHCSSPSRVTEWKPGIAGSLLSSSLFLLGAGSSFGQARTCYAHVDSGLPLM